MTWNSQWASAYSSIIGFSVGFNMGFIIGFIMLADIQGLTWGSDWSLKVGFNVESDMLLDDNSREIEEEKNN